MKSSRLVPMCLRFVVVVLLLCLGGASAQNITGGIVELPFDCIDLGDILPDGINVDGLGELCGEVLINLCDLEIGVYIEYDEEVLLDEYAECVDIVDDLDCQQCIGLSEEQDSEFKPDKIKVCPVVYTQCTVFGIPIRSGETDVGCFEFGDECKSFNASCETCGKQEGCGWCEATRTCKPIAPEDEEEPFCDECKGLWITNSLVCAQELGTADDAGGFAGEATTALTITFTFIGLALILLAGFLLYRRHRNKNQREANVEMTGHAGDFAPLRLQVGEGGEASSSMIVSSDIQYEVVAGPSN
jgi:LPXTG-motif cell wall-anchored protein